MDNQHREISGYRELTHVEINLMNLLKTFEADLGDLLGRVAAHVATTDDAAAARWLALARTELETGMMYAVKAVARPTNGLGRR